MKIKAVQFGNGQSDHRRKLPGMQGTHGELYVGEKLQGAGRVFFVGSLDYDRQGGVVTVRLVDGGGKPYRRWDESENVRTGRECDALQFTAEKCFFFVDDEQPQQGQQQRGK